MDSVKSPEVSGDRKNDSKKLSAFLVNCPACKEPVLIDQVNCGIFRHAFYTDTLKTVDPHASKRHIMETMACGRLGGCGAPFEVVDGRARMCDYTLQQARSQVESIGLHPHLIQNCDPAVSE